MKKIRRIITMLIAGALAITFTSCDMFAGMADSLKDDFSKWWGDPAAEGNELKCGIAHEMTISGDIIDYFGETISCEHIDLDPNFGLRGQFTAYNGTNEYEYRGDFFYKENTDDVSKGEFYIDVKWVWDTKKSEWSTPNHAFNRFDSKNHYYKASNVNLTTETTANINLSELITYEEYEAAHDEMVKIIHKKHSGDDNTAGLTKDNIFDPDERDDRFRFIENFETALNGHSSSSTTVSYEKVKNVFTYVAKVDGNTLELMIFSDDELFFYPYEGNDNTYMLGMYSYNQASYYDEEGHLDYTKNKAARKWIRENYPNIGSLYKELFEKATTAKAEAKKKAEAEYEEYKKSQE